MKINGINEYNSDIIKETYRSSQDVKKDFAGLLYNVQQQRDHQRLKEACIEMEAVFFNTLLERMRATVVKGGLIEESLGESIFTSMLDSQLAEEASKAKGLGIADMLYRQLSTNLDR